MLEQLHSTHYKGLITVKSKKSILGFNLYQGRTWKKIDGWAPGSGRVQFFINSYNFIQKY